MSRRDERIIGAAVRRVSGHKKKARVHGCACCLRAVVCVRARARVCIPRSLVLAGTCAWLSWCSSCVRVLRQVLALGWNCNGSYLASGSADQTARLWELAGHSLVRRRCCCDRRCCRWLRRVSVSVVVQWPLRQSAYLPALVVCCRAVEASAAPLCR
jgi:hypothetical protein